MEKIVLALGVYLTVIIAVPIALLIGYMIPKMFFRFIRFVRKAFWGVNQ